MINVLNFEEMWDISLLAVMLYREARGASFNAKVQVAWTVKNRVDNSKWWGKTYSEVITKPWQYSSMTDPHDRQLVTWPLSNNVIMKECLEIAWAVYHSKIHPTYLHADSYFDHSIEPPKWATKDKFVGRIDNLSFYNIDGDGD